MPKTPKAEPDDAEAGMASVRAVDRAIAILQCFSADQPAMSVIDIQKRVGLSRPT
ncbi:helix-turn-helix domain-containing protein, partial [Klebsiella pneumoniae]|uniref:helix-turn-helix domain-containing protein n=1 Tax=Klebsiella pneumoniae TaxID=573 RepID=UPI001BA5FE15|nr:helix-turn-helix domain-containing protein [Klebsiella pneumoniae]